MSEEGLPKNLRAPVKRVLHSTLKRYEPQSAYKSDCPACPDGLLLVRRVMGVLQREDYCLCCGQPVYYLDETINGERLIGNTPS
jgi:hypothetical protein